jgi:hypothetical protein
LALFGVALSARVARKIRANDLLVVLVARSQSSPPRARHQNEEEIQHPRARVCVVIEEKKKDDTYLGGTNAFSPSTLPPCDPGAAAYAWSSKSKLCSLAGVRPGILCGILSSSKVVFDESRPKLKCFCGETTTKMLSSSL